MQTTVILATILGAATAAPAIIAWEQLSQEPPKRSRPECSCGRPAAWLRLLPFGFLVSRLAGKDRCSCGTRQPLSRAGAEVGFALLAGLLAAAEVAYLPAVFFIVWCCVVLSVTDIKEYIIPDEINYSLLLAGLVCSPWLGLGESAFWAAICGGSFWLFGWLAGAVMKKEALGFGDVKLVAAFGAWLGWKSVYAAIMIGSVLGLAGGIALLLAGRSERMLPFGPFLAGGFLLYLFWGEKVSRFLLPF